VVSNPITKQNCGQLADIHEQTDPKRDDLDRAVKALGASLTEVGYSKP